MMEELRFPIGKYTKPEVIDFKIYKEYIGDIQSFPIQLKEAVENLSDLQLDTPYRHDGWTIRQVVHHCADSHMNSFIRFKLALTEDKPVIKPYFEDRWAELGESKFMPLEASLKIIEGVHERWVVLLKSLSESEMKRTLIHPEHGTEISIEENAGIYSWHCRHHLAHIKNLIKVKGWK